MRYLFIFLGIVFLMVAAGGVFLYKNNHQTKKSNDAPLTGGIPVTETTIITTAVSDPAPTLRSGQIPILMYHYIRDYNDPKDELGRNLSVSPKVFDTQMKWLKDNGYETIGIDELKTTTAKKPVVLTFDDGYTSAYTEAFPILQKYNFKGVFYLISNYLNGGWYLTKDQAREMDRAGMVIGAHTKNHIDLEKAPVEKQRDEIVGSKQRIEEVVGHKITDFCYPSGKYTPETIKILEEAGFLNAVTTHPGIAKNNDNLFELPRLRIDSNTDLASKLSQ